MSQPFPHYIDKAWRFTIFDENEDPNIVANVCRLEYERIPYTDASLTTQWDTPPDRGDIPATSATDGGKAKSVSIPIGTEGLNSTQAKAFDLNAAVTAVKPNINFNNLKLSDFRFFLKAFSDILDDQSEQRRRLTWQLGNGDIDQATYDAAIALLVPTSDG